ncbi:TPA: hypothetical protein SLP05_003178 [Pseudomonas putida]|uniref:hypothetical protein n=1 Tax=Pseudomonas putida group TaxID=136845 RepID=UPI001E2F2FE3|nr:hypothetical protein [Pseudomonas alloputida]MCE0905711.1 hypothetical protein [Pseudomonas alloputida]HEJ1055600.1 hypothetical protein [Pseudomonas putida]
MNKHIIALERRNLAELEVIERLVVETGAEAFEADARRLSNLHTVDPGSAIQAIRRLIHSSIIGMSDIPFQIFQRLSDDVVMRAPALLQRPSYRYRNGDNTAIPHELWLAIVRHAREYYDPAGLDADFLAARQREGLSNREAFDALIASKRRK